MSLFVKQINIIGNYSPAFSAHKRNNYAVNEENPISKTGETMNLIKGTFLGGLTLGIKLLYELRDNDFLFEKAFKKADKIVSKNHKNLSPAKELLYLLGATAGIVLAGISAFALVYTAFNSPKIKYNSNVNTFTKTKDMDVFINANNAEKGIYTELSKRAKGADNTERNKLKQQYMKMQMVKNKPPEWSNYNYKNSKLN